MFIKNFYEGSIDATEQPIVNFVKEMDFRTFRFIRYFITFTIFLWLISKICHSAKLRFKR